MLEISTMITTKHFTKQQIMLEQLISFKRPSDMYMIYHLKVFYVRRARRTFEIFRDLRLITESPVLHMNSNTFFDLILFS